VQSGGEGHAPSSEPALYRQLLNARRAKRLGFTVSAALLTVAGILSVKVGLVEQPPPAQFTAALAVLAAGADAFVFIGGGAAFAALWLTNSGRVSFEWHTNRVWLERGVPPTWGQQQPVLGPGSLEVLRGGGREPGCCGC